ncbi:MAG: hypothetical protein JWQ35_1200 [Bacteriovoracaceae bacterium]|nr:hypothetical protein [Bacteriovoracaceae bacterium]
MGIPKRKSKQKGLAKIDFNPIPLPHRSVEAKSNTRQIHEFMTPNPLTIELNSPLFEAEKQMKELEIRHLPVVLEGRLVGIITDRDITLVKTYRDVELQTATVRDGYLPLPYTVSPSALLSEVCETMHKNKMGCALVADGEDLVGIFTWIDGIKLLKKLLKNEL